MAKEKKSAKAGRNTNSKSAQNYKTSNRWYFNKVKKIKRHCKHQPHDVQAHRVLKGIQSTLAMEYVRGSEKVQELHQKAMAC